MESNGNSRGGLLSAGGVLLIISGIFQIIGVAALVVSFFFREWVMSLLVYGPGLMFVPRIAGSLLQFISYADLEGGWPVLFAAGAGILAIVAIVGGISAIRRNRFGLSLAGGICAVPLGMWGILGVIFVVLGKREFDASEVEIK